MREQEPRRRGVGGSGGQDSQGDGEVAEIGQSYTTLHNILQLKKCKEAGANKKGS